MKLTIELELTDHDARVLRSWASVGRYFDSVRRFADHNDIPDSLDHEAISVIEDSATLKQPLDSLHQQIRPKLIEMGIKSLWRQLGDEDQRAESSSNAESK